MNRQPFYDVGNVDYTKQMACPKPYYTRKTWVAIEFIP